MMQQTSSIFVLLFPAHAGVIHSEVVPMFFMLFAIPVLLSVIQIAIIYAKCRRDEQSYFRTPSAAAKKSRQLMDDVRKGTIKRHCPEKSVRSCGRRGDPALELKYRPGLSLHEKVHTLSEQPYRGWN